MDYYVDAEYISLDEVRERIEATDLVPSRAPLLNGIQATFTALQARGITTLARLRNELKNAKRLETVVQATGIDVQYLVLLRREIESWFPKPFPLRAFDWIPEGEITQLEENGIDDTAALYEAAGSTQGRDALARSTGADAAILESLVRLADLTRVQWVSPTAARMLVEATCDGASKLAEANAEDLYEALVRVNQGDKFYKGKIGLRDIKRLVRAASSFRGEEETEVTRRDRDEAAGLGVETQAIHAGEYSDPLTGATAPNIVMSTTFVADPKVSFSAEDIDDETPYVYTRWGNPTIAQLERKLAVLEDAEGCVAFASGVAAATAVLLRTLGSGDHLVMSDVTYAAVSEFANDTLPRLGVSVTRVDTSDPRNVAEALRAETRLIYLESPANPLLRLTDIQEVARIAHAAGVKVAVDSTFATPIAVKPIELGADYVVHSLTKYVCGHGDAIAGAVLGRTEDLSAIRSVAIHTGGVVSPFNAWLVLRGAATLPLRMRAHEQGALSVARWLETHPKVSRVIYPGLSSHPQHELAVRQLRNFSGMLTFQVEDGPAMAHVLYERLRIVHYAVSLGHQRSLIYYLPTDALLRSSFHLTPEQELGYRAFAGDGIFRLSVGLEDPADIISDLEQAFAAV